MIEEKIKTLEIQVLRLKNRVDSLNIRGDYIEISREIQQIKCLIETYLLSVDEIDADLFDSSDISSKKILINKLTQNRNDLEITKRKFLEKENQFNAKNAIRALENKTGANRYMAERNAILEQHREIEIQGDIINSISENLRSIRTFNNKFQKYKEMNRISKNQDEQIKNNNKLLETNNNIIRIEETQRNDEQININNKVLNSNNNIINKEESNNQDEQMKIKDKLIDTNDNVIEKEESDDEETEKRLLYIKILRTTAIFLFGFFWGALIIHLIHS